MNLELDIGDLEPDTQAEMLQEILETVPDRIIANAILGFGTQELADLLKTWVNEPVDTKENEVEEVQSEEVRGPGGADLQPDQEPSNS